MSATTPAKRFPAPDLGELQSTILAVEGIFWALGMLVVQGVADEVAHAEDRATGIAGRILAGELLTAEVSKRF